MVTTQEIIQNIQKLPVFQKTILGFVFLAVLVFTLAKFTGFTLAPGAITGWTCYNLQNKILVDWVIGDPDAAYLAQHVAECKRGENYWFGCMQAYVVSPTGTETRIFSQCVTPLYAEGATTPYNYGISCDRSKWQPLSGASVYIPNDGNGVYKVKVSIQPKNPIGTITDPAYWTDSITSNCVKITPAPTECADGTKYGECSITKPLYCTTSGSLIKDANKCGCPDGFANSNGICCPEGTTNVGGRCTTITPTPTPTCTTGDKKTKTCPDGSTIVTEECINGQFVSTGITCPVVSACTTGEKKTQTCPDGTVIVIEECVDGTFKSTGNVCPGVPPSPCTPGGTPSPAECKATCTTNRTAENCRIYCTLNPQDPVCAPPFDWTAYAIIGVAILVVGGALYYLLRVRKR